MPAISLETDGSGWYGTFGGAITHIAQDLLSDGGTPVDDVRVSTLDGEMISGSLTAADASSVTVRGRVINIETINGLYVD